MSRYLILYACAIIAVLYLIIIYIIVVFNEIKYKNIEKPSIDLVNWMYKLPESKKNLKIYDLFIPGSHNSGSYEYNNYLGTIINTPNIPYPFTYKNIFSYIKRWSINQKLSVFEQLKSGIRYIRFKCIYHNNEMYSEHTLIGVRMSIILKDILTFITNTKEVVIIHFSNIQCTNKEYNIFKKYVENMFKDTLEINFKIKSLKELIESNKRSIIIFNKIYSPYCKNCTNFKDSLSKIDEYITNKPSSEYGNIWSIELSETILPKTIIYNPFGSVLNRAVINNNIVIDWLKTKRKFNITISDKVEDIAPFIINLNLLEEV